MALHIRRFLAVLCLAAPGLCTAGGSVDFAVVDRLIRQQPAVHAWLSSTLVLPDTAFAEVRFGPHFKHLSGGRMGPYKFRAQSRSAGAGGEIEVIACTEPRFLDNSGRRLPDSELENAVHVEETLASVQVRDWRADAGSPLCPK